MPKILPHRVTLSLAAALATATALHAQQAPLYPGLDLPGAPTQPVTQYADLDDSPDASSGLAAGSADWSHIAPTASPFVRDLNGDGHMDGVQLIDGVSAWLGAGDGRFGEPFRLASHVSSTSPLTGRTADVNADGLPDVVFVGQTSGPVFSVVDHQLARHDGTFLHGSPSAVQLPVDFAVHEWDLAHMDDDQWPDMVGRKGYGLPGATLSIAFGTGSTTYDRPADLAAPAGFIDRPALGDLDNDGATDIAALVGSPVNELQSYMQSGGGGFALFDTVGVAQSSYGLSLVDGNGDGTLDVLIDRSTAQELHFGNGNGGFAVAPVAVPHAGRFMRFFDVDLDGLVDVVSRQTSEPFAPQVSLARPDGTLSAPIVTPHQADPLGLADFDEDGVPDLWTVQLMLPGLGDGGFSSPRGFDIGVRVLMPQSLALADLDGDGRDDVIAAHGDSTAAVAVFDRGAATWSAPVPFPTSVPVRAVAAADLDEDGDTDVLMTPVFGGFASLFVNQGDGAFIPGDDVFLDGLFGRTGLGFGRFNSNGHADLITVDSGLLSLRRGNGDLTFGPLLDTPLPAGSSFTTWLQVQDMTDDDFDDVFVLNGDVLLYRSLGHDAFAAPVLVAAGADAASVADVDNDGLLDVVTSDLTINGSIVSVALGDGAGAFTSVPAWDFDPELQVRTLALGDANGDGRDDLALAGDISWKLHLGDATGGFETDALDTFDLPSSALLMRFHDVNADGHRDLQAFGRDTAATGFPLGLGIHVAIHTGGPWRDAGFGLGGLLRRPYLLPLGSLLGETPMGLEVAGAAPSAATHLVIGLAPLFAPLKGGVLVPEPEILLSGIPTSHQGTLALSSVWPAGIPTGLDFWMQVWIEDASGPLGLTATNGVSGTTP